MGDDSHIVPISEILKIGCDLASEALIMSDIVIYYLSSIFIDFWLSPTLDGRTDGLTDRRRTDVPKDELSFVAT